MLFSTDLLKQFLEDMEAYCSVSRVVRGRGRGRGRGVVELCGGGVVCVGVWCGGVMWGVCVWWCVEVVEWSGVGVVGVCSVLIVRIAYVCV